MSGGGVAYHLRPAKAVERRLFIELLEVIDRWRSVRDAVYVSLGGWLLEDHKLVHDRFETKALVSIESDDVVFARQVFNAPLGIIDCRPIDTSAFVEEFDTFTSEHPDASRVIWFDYASASNRQGQLREVQTLITKLDAGDVLKVTLNASVRTLCDWEGTADPKERQRQALDGLERKLGHYMPAGAVANQMNDEGVAAILLEAVQKAVLDGLTGSRELIARPLTAFRYSDGPHQMLTIAIALVKEDDLANFEAQTRLAEWPFALAEWGPIQAIKVPDLSLRERLHIDARLFTKSEAMIHADLPFRFHKNAGESLATFKDYVSHYRRYPSFVRISS